MEWLQRLPKDWRIALVIAVGTLVGYQAAQRWVISIAEAQDAPQRAALDEMRPMLREVYLACVRRGECDGKAAPK